MRYWAIISLIVAAIIVLSAEMFPKLPLIETYVSPTCGACINFCRDMNDLYFPDYVDSMVFVVYMAGFSDAGGRIDYYSTFYSITGVPWTALNGGDMDHLVAENVFNYACDSVHTTPHCPIGFHLLRYSADSVVFNVYTDSASYEGEYLLFALVVQDSVDDVHNRVCTQFLTSQRGSLITVIAGEPTEFGFPLDLDFSVPMRLYSAVFFLQKPDTPVVVNAFHTSMVPRPAYDFIVRQAQKRYLLPIGTITTIPFRVINAGTMDDVYHLRLENEAPSGWEAYFPDGNIRFDLPVRAFGDTTAEFEIVVPSRGWGEIALIAASDSIPGREDTLTFFVVSGGECLLVGDTRTPEDSLKYQSALEELGKSYIYWDIARDGEIFSLEGIDFDYLIWFCGEDTTENIAGDERIALENYILGGGKVLLSGAGIGYANQEAFLFFRDALGAHYEGFAEDFSAVRGTTSHIFLGFYGELEEIDFAETYTAQEGGRTVFLYPDGAGAGVAKDDVGRSIVLGFPAERLPDGELTDFLERCITFFDEGFAGIGSSAPGRMEISVSPNPFNDVCEIRAPGGSRIEIYDLRGGLVLSQTTETSSLLWRAENMPAGVYLLKISTPEGETATRKVLLIR